MPGRRNLRRTTVEGMRGTLWTIPRDIIYLEDSRAVYQTHRFYPRHDGEKYEGDPLVYYHVLGVHDEEGDPLDEDAVLCPPLQEEWDSIVEKLERKIENTSNPDFGYRISRSYAPIDLNSVREGASVSSGPGENHLRAVQPAD